VTAAVELRDAFRIYRTESGATAALQGLDLSLEAEEIVVVLGPSGAGKTTLLRVLAGLEQLSAGSARVFGVDLGHLDAAGAAGFRAAQVGLLDQHYARSLSADLSCRHNVSLQLELAGAPRRPSRVRAGALLEQVGLAERADDRPGTLSGGEQQRVAVCAAIAHSPRLLLADEPAGELDAGNALRVYRLLGELVHNAGATALIVSHDASAATIADRLVYIRDGRIVEQAQPGGERRLVVSRKGWVRLPQGRRDRADEARVVGLERDGDRFVLELPGAAEAEAAASTTARAAAGSEPSGPIRAELEDVGKRFGSDGGGHVVFADISRSFRAGRLTGLVGRSGSGKTTILHLLAGLERPTTGRVRVLGEDITSRSREQLALLRRNSIALVTQEPGLIPYLTALENVELGLRLRRSADPERAGEALHRVGLDERREHRAADLSAGERERVAIARALASDCAILLVDEPTARLDEENAHAIAALLADAAHLAGLAVVCATHDDVLIAAADETLRLD
jgi:ABC-type lipoprotein export system ATPase subunit